MMLLSDIGHADGFGAHDCDDDSKTVRANSLAPLESCWGSAPYPASKTRPWRILWMRDKVRLPISTAR